MTVRTLRAGIVVAALLTSCVAGVAIAADEAGWGYGLANSLMSPYCPGRSLPDCPSAQAAQLREWIIAQDTAGRARADVESELIERYGEEILQAPRARGFGLTAYVTPLLAFLVGGVVVAVFLRRQGRRMETPGAESRPDHVAARHDPDLERALEAELTGRD